MATVVSLTQTKIEELMSGWQGVSLSQDAINAVVSQLWTDVQSNGAVVSNFENVVVPDLLEQTNAGAIALDNLVTNQLPTLEADITANSAAIENLDTVELPLLQDRVHTNELWIIDLNEEILPELYTQLDANNALISDFNTVTLPALTTRLDEVEGNVFDPGPLNSQIAALQSKFPVVGDDISANAITANKIASHTITALQIAADTITANEIAADAVTANEIAANAVTASEIAAGSVIADKIAADAVTANKIAADAVTAAKIAANAVTASKIAAGTITGDKIAANTIAASRLTLSDMTNLVADGELLDPNAVNWDNVPRVDPVNDWPYLENANTYNAAYIWTKNYNLFGISPGDEFNVSLEISAPSTNTETLKFSPAFEVYDRDGASALWRVVDTGFVSVAPGSEWIAVRGVIALTDDNITAARFNPYVSDIAGALGSQKIRLRRIMVRRRNGGELIIDGSLNAKQIDVQSLTADIVNTGILQAGLTITGSLSIAGGEMGWSKDKGLWFGNGTAFYGDDRINQIEGDLVTQSISIKDGLSLGGNADVHGVMEMGNGVSTPSVAPSLGQTWPKSSIPMFAHPVSGEASDLSNNFHGLHNYDSVTWISPFTFYGTGFRKANKSDLSWAGDLTVSLEWAEDYYPVGFTALGASYYLLGKDVKRGSQHYIYRLSNSGTIVKKAEVYLGPLTMFNNMRPRLVSDGVNVGLLRTTTDGALMLSWFNAGLTERVGSDITLLTGVGLRHVGAAYYGPLYSGGPNRLVVSLYDGDSNMVRAWTLGGTLTAPTATRSTTDDFPRASAATVIGLTYDPSQDRMMHMDRYTHLHTYSKYKDGGTISARYTFYDGNNAVYPSGTVVNGVDVSGQASGTHETSASPMATYALSKRAWPTFSTPPAPDELVTDATKVDKANRIGAYMSLNGTPRLQSYLPVGTRALPITDELSTSSALVGSSGVQSFANASVPSPGSLLSRQKNSSGDAMIALLGDGSGRLGSRSWNENGLWTPLCRAAIAGNAQQDTATGVEQLLNLPTTFYNSGCTISTTGITVGKTGFYRIDLMFSWAALAGGSRIGILRYNGSTMISWTVPHAGASTHVNASFTHYLPLVAGNVISMAQYQSSGSVIKTYTQTYPRLYVQQIDDQ